MGNPHALPAGIAYWTSNPFDAMSIAARVGADVDRYFSGQYIPGMISRGDCFFGYGVTRGDGFELINLHAKKLVREVF